jgi:hypothetical protein
MRNYLFNLQDPTSPKFQVTPSSVVASNCPVPPWFSGDRIYKSFFHTELHKSRQLDMPGLEFAKSCSEFHLLKRVLQKRTITGEETSPDNWKVQSLTFIDHNTC